MSGPRYLGPPLRAPGPPLPAPRYLGPPLAAPGPEHRPLPAQAAVTPAAAAAAVPTLEHYISNLHAVPIGQRSVAQQGELATYQARLTDYQGIATPSTALAPAGAGISTPTGVVPIGSAAAFDAANLAAMRSGYPATAAAAPFAGVAASTKYNGVIGVGTGTGVLYHAFRDGVLVGTMPGGTGASPTAWAASLGIDPNAFGTVAERAAILGGGPRGPLVGTLGPFTTSPPAGLPGSSSPITAAGSGTPTATALLATGTGGVPPAYGSASGGSPINGGGGSGQVAASGGGISMIDVLLIGGAVVAGLVLTKSKKGHKA